MAQTSLREQNKVRTREALVEAAFELFREKGFEGTSVDEIATRAHVSRRTFFRYFSTKEAVVFPDREARLVRFRELLARRGRERPFTAVRRSFLALAEELTRDRQSVLQQQQIIEASPTLTARDVQLDREWEVAVADALTEPRASRQDRRMAEIRAGAALGAVRATLRAWHSQGGRPDLVKLGAEGLELLERIFQPDRSRTTKRPLQRGKR